MNLNKVMVAGTLGADPEVKQLQSGQSVASFSIACNERYKDKQGNQVDKTEWVNIVFWGNRANVIQQYVRKGSKIFVEGKLETQSWDDPNGGGKRYKTQVVGSDFKFLGGKQDDSQDGQPNQPQNQQFQQQGQQQPVQNQNQQFQQQPVQNQNQQFAQQNQQSYAPSAPGNVPNVNNAPEDDLPF